MSLGGRAAADIGHGAPAGRDRPFADHGTRHPSRLRAGRGRTAGRTRAATVPVSRTCARFHRLRGHGSGGRDRTSAAPARDETRRPHPSGVGQAIRETTIPGRGFRQWIRTTSFRWLVSTWRSRSSSTGPCPIRSASSATTFGASRSGRDPTAHGHRRSRMRGGDRQPAHLVSDPLGAAPRRPPGAAASARLREYGCPVP